MLNDSAVANYYLLKKFDDGEKSALQGIRVDEAHQIPKLQCLLGMKFCCRSRTIRAPLNTFSCSSSMAK